MIQVAVFLAHVRHLADIESPGRRSGILHLGEERRLASMGSTKRRGEFLLGRFLARQALEHGYGQQARSWHLEVDRHGRPFVVAPGCAAPGISISHSGEWAACALCGADALGVDIEAVKSRDIDRLALEALAPAEQSALRALSGPDRLQAFYRFWTLKEAFLKALGRGLDLALLGELAFALDSPPRLIRTPVDPRPWQFRSFRVAPGYVAALAVSGCTLLPALMVMTRAGRFVPRGLGT